MNNLIASMPVVSIMMLIGMAGMFLAPFGMLISKWAVLKAVIDTAPMISLIIIFGSAATLFFWVKWMGKLVALTHKPQNLENTISLQEWIPLWLLAILTVVVCALFPLVSAAQVEPYVKSVYGFTASMSHGNVIIMLVMLGLVLLFPISILKGSKKTKIVAPYLGGANVSVESGDDMAYHGAIGSVKHVHISNYYLDMYFGESRLFTPGVLICAAAVILMFGAVLL
jgi:ech hydrogenase subunit A